MNQATRYNKISVLLHWLIAIGIFAMFALGWYMAELPKEAPKQMAFDFMDLGIYAFNLPEAISPRTFYFNLHKSIGISLFALILIRLYWRITHKPPAMLHSYKVWERKLSTAAHHLLYLLMLAIPLSGLTMAIASKYGVMWFGVKLINGIDNHDLREVFEGIHELAGIVMLIVLALHIAGALKHKFIDKDDTMQRMSL